MCGIVWHTSNIDIHGIVGFAMFAYFMAMTVQSLVESCVVFGQFFVRSTL